jgi:hypothetical protein
MALGMIVLVVFSQEDCPIPYEYQIFSDFYSVDEHLPPNTVVCPIVFVRPDETIPKR